MTAFDVAAMMLPELKQQQMYYAFKGCGSCSIAAQTRVIEFEGIEDKSNLANNTDDIIDTLADRNSEYVNQHVIMVLPSFFNNLKAVLHWATVQTVNQNMSSTPGIKLD